MFGNVGFMETRTKFGIDKTELMITYWPVIMVEGFDKGIINAELVKIKAFLAEKMGRELTEEEYIGLLSALRDFAGSDGGSDERRKSLDCLINLEFIKE